MTKTVFVVDDNDINLAMAREALKEQYKVITIPSAAKLFSLIEKLTPDMILLDIEMPEVDGFEALSKLKSIGKYASIPVIFLTAMTDEQVEVRGFQMGAIDFIPKPFSAPVLLNRVKTHLDVDELIHERTRQIQDLQNGIIYVLADMVENRDHVTGSHIDRITSYLTILIAEMLAQGLYSDELSELDINSFISSARLHDIGKITIPDAVLNKPGKLTDEEFTLMKTHTSEGERIIDQIVMRTGNVDFLRNARLFAGTHHERWDGKGYPAGLSDTQIPLHGRIMSIVDVYDALVSERPYKKAFSSEVAYNIVKEGCGTQFDPHIFDVFHAVSDKFASINSEQKANS